MEDDGKDYCVKPEWTIFWDTNLWYSRKNLVSPAVEAEWKSSLVRREGIIWAISLSDDAVYIILSLRESYECFVKDLQGLNSICDDADKHS